MKLILLLFSGCFAAGIVVLVIGFCLPREFVATRTTIISAPSDHVFGVVTDPISQPIWRSDLIEVRDDGEGQWTEIPKRGDPIRFAEIRREVPYLYEIEFSSQQGFAGKWVGTFESVSRGTRVTFTETIVVSNPIFRVIARLFRLPDKFMDDYLASLRRRMTAA
jgi:hypothetical protein